jgi:hypothetical protein
MNIGDTHQTPHEIKVRPGEGSVSFNGCGEKVSHTEGHEMTRRLFDSDSRVMRPPLDENALAGRIQSNDDSITVISPKESAEHLLMAKSERAQNDTTHPTIEQLAHFRLMPQPSSHLDGNFDPLGNPHE